MTFMNILAPMNPCPHAPMHACRVFKLLSEDPTNYADAPREGIRRVLEEVRSARRGPYLGDPRPQLVPRVQTPT